MTEIADDLGRCVSIISDWLVRAHKDGTRSRDNKEHLGKECKLSDEQLTQMEHTSCHNRKNSIKTYY